MSTSRPTEGEWTVQEVIEDPWTLLETVAHRLDGDWTTFYPFVLTSGSVVLGLVISIEGGGEGPGAVTAPGWAALLVEALMPLAVLLVYPVGLVAAYMVARLVFGSARIDAFLAFAIVVGVATATKAAAIMFGAMF